MNAPRRATTAAPIGEVRAAKHQEAARVRRNAIDHLHPLTWAVRTLSSVRLAMALLLALAATVLVGTLVDQEPPTVRSDPAAHQRWLQNAHATYGRTTGLLEQLGLFNVFHGLFFRGLMALLAASILVCTARRWRPIWNTVFHTRVGVSENFVTHARFHTRLDVPLPRDEVAPLVRRALSRSRYAVRAEADDSGVVLFGDKNRLSRFGTFFTHLSLILILAGAIAGGIWGFKDPAFVVAEGATRDLGLGTGISVRLDRSVNDYYPDGRPKTLQSDLTLLENGTPVKSGSVLVNSPLRYKGIAFHESYFGQSVVMKVQDSTGRELFAGAVPLELRSADGLRPVGRFELPDYGVSVLLVGAVPGARDALVPSGEIRVDVYQDSVRAIRPVNLSQGTPAELLEGLTFTFERESLFAGLQVVKDPGTIIIWIAGALMVLGMVMLFYLPPRRLWVRCQHQPDGTALVLIGMPAQRDVSLAGEFRRVTNRISRELGVETSNPPHGGTNV